MRSLHLDILRIFLCGLVVDHHLFYVFQAGGLSVIGFFVMAGYFLAKHFEKCGAAFNSSAFYVKKAENLLPEFAVGAALGVGKLLMGAPFGHRNLGDCPFTLMSLAEALNYPSWFMTCLFMFFVLAPVFHGLYRTPRGIHLAFLAAFIYSAVLFSFVDNSRMLYYSSQCNLVYFLAGMSAQRIWDKTSLNVCGRRILLAGAFFLLVTFIMICDSFTSWDTYGLVVGYASCVLYMILIPLLDTPQCTSSGWQRLIVWAASLTYAVFLFHAPIYQFYSRLISKYNEVSPYPATQIIAVSLAVLAAALFVPLKKRLFNLFHKKFA